ncbi:tetratricopeptide repeat protein [Solimonas soli]|uniref:tetratricopeptide repeat protein n=1 Tax=Solimonas soli TaxID=413479 RepID=UPI0004B0CAFC|nr:hypothetical protein [Solimonas soli]
MAHRTPKTRRMSTQSTHLAAAAILLLAAQGPVQAASKTVRPEIGQSLQGAQKALQAKQFQEARAQIAKAENAGKLTPYESYLVARLKASAAIGLGDYRAALSAYEQVVDSSELPAEEKLQVLDSFVKLAYTAKDYGRAAAAVQKYRAAGGNDAQTLGLYAQSLYLAGRYAEAGNAVADEIRELEASGRRPTDSQLQLLGSCALKRNDMKAYIAALEKIVVYTPKPQYWIDLILRTAGQPGFSDRLDLDVYRLRKATGTMEKAGDYMEATQLALQAGFPGEAQGFVEEGFQRKLLGTGPDTARDERLKALVAKKLADDQATLAEGEKAAAAQPTGDALVATGFNLVTYGQADKGLSLMQQGIAKGGLKFPDQARLHLGYAQLLAGKKGEAAKVLASVKGSDGSASLARLWAIKLRAGT